MSAEKKEPHSHGHHGRPVVLLDLDGTLVDPAGSITGGIAATLAQHGLPTPTPEQLRCLVGPPLRTGLLTLEGVTEENVSGLIQDYRAEYWATGMAASRPYPGITEALTELVADHTLAVATSKPVSAARRLLALQGLDHFFHAVCGASDDEQAPLPPQGTKVEAISQALAAVGRMSGDPQAPVRQVVMVGDRHYDLDGAAHHGLPSVGVLWGFAGPGELEAATAVCADPRDLPAVCRNLQNGVS